MCVLNCTNVYVLLNPGDVKCPRRKSVEPGESVSEVKNKGGRPRRVPGEKLKRVTLNLRPSILFGLELIARDRQTSLSQAAEFALATVLRGYDIDGKSALNIAGSAMLIEREKPLTKSELGILLRIYEHDEQTKDETKWNEAFRGAMMREMERLQRGESPLSVFAVPERLRTPEESFLVAVVKLAPLNLAVAVDEQCRKIQEAFRMGLSVEDAAKQMIETFRPKKTRAKKK